MHIRNPTSLKPTLNSGVVSMAKLSRQGADAATVQDDVCVSHTHSVRFKRTDVNVENVAAIEDNARMTDDETLGKKLRDLYQRSGRSMHEIAKIAGYAAPSSIQRYFSEEYDAEALPVNIASKLAKGFVGTRVAKEEIMALANLPSMLEGMTFAPEEGPRHSPRDIPVYGTALGTLLDVEGERVEQTFLDQGDTITYFTRPQALNRRADVYGVYIQGSSMAPRFQEGEIAFAETMRPPHVGDDVLVFLVGSDQDDGERMEACLIKRLVRRSASYVELEQFNPAVTFKIDAARIKKIHRIIPWGELLA